MRSRPKPKQQPAFPVLAPPSEMKEDAKAVWVNLAPLACEMHTLTEQTAPAFRDLCEAVVIRDAMASRIDTEGFTYEKIVIDGAGQEHRELRAHPLVNPHRGMMQRVEAGYTRFRLAPMGKELVLPVKEEDPFEQFDGVQ
jgi:P27 family predicted phage terminase small subunit